MYEIFIVFAVIRLAIANTEVNINNVLTKKDSIDWYLNEYEGTNHNPYCKICCIDIKGRTIGKKCGDHTLCKYQNVQIGPACKGFVNIFFTRNEKSVLIDAHNTLRNRVATGTILEGKPGPQPTASNMRAMEWSDELAKIAEKWAAQCIYGNDICRDLDKFPVGQNIAKGTVATNSDVSLVQHWFNQVKYFNKSYIGNYKNIKNGKFRTSHYTQLIWADSYLLGCARAIFQTSKGARVVYREHLICNYGPAGNIPGQPIYNVGDPCSACHEGTICNGEYPALCSSDKTDEFYDYLEETRTGGSASPLLNSYSLIVVFCKLFF